MERNAFTITQTENSRILRIKPDRKNVKFSEETIDNEGMNKKKSNSIYYLVCCIFRKKDCSSDSSSGDENNDYERQPKYKKK